MKKAVIVILGLFLAAGCSKTASPAPAPTPQSQSATTTSVTPTPPPTPAKTMLHQPIDGALARVTKKPFGIYITKQNSPVQPEKFSGYHTGVDFEATADEQNMNVSIYAACDGKLLMKKYATGYGGVAVQSCNLDGNPVTIIYGHVRLSSVTPNVGDQLKAGDKIAVLGTGNSTETDGERKHLHFGIHKDTAVNILGYVQKQADLSGWLNAEDYFK